MSHEYTASCGIRSHSHELNEEAFVVLTDPRCTFDVLEIRDNVFWLAVHSKGLPVKSHNEWASFGAASLSRFLMALNIGTLGHFDWSSKDSSSASYSVLNSTTQEAFAVVSKQRYSYPKERIQQLEESHIGSSVYLLDGIAKDIESHVQQEYLQGIFHLGHEFYDLDFSKAAFSNFYRCAEYFVTKRILRKRKLSNELKEFGNAFSAINFPDELADIFAEHLYPVRSAQVMHAQAEQTKLTWDTVLDMKVVTDAIMHHFYLSKK